MKKNISEKKKNNFNYLLWIMLPFLSIAFYIIRITSEFSNSQGIVYSAYPDSYLWILLAEFAVVSVMFIPFLIKAKETEDLHIYLLPLMLISALGMLRTDTEIAVTKTATDHTQALMFIIFFASILIMAFSGYTITGVVGSIIGTAVFPTFGFVYSPFIAAASFLSEKEDSKDGRISKAANSAVSLLCIIWGIIKCEITRGTFSKKLIPVLLLSAGIFTFLLIKKEYKYLPFSLLSLFPLFAGIFTTAFPSPLFTLSASVTPVVIIFFTSALAGKNEKTKGCALSLVHNPTLYIIAAVFILHTAVPTFLNPGFFAQHL